MSRICEVPGCNAEAITFTHNFDNIAKRDPKKKMELGYVDHEEHTGDDCMSYYWDYIWVCGGHMSKLTSKYWHRAKQLGYFSK